MPTFTYRGYNASGHKVGGYLNEATRAAAESRLDARGVTGYALFRSQTSYGDGVTLPLRPIELSDFCREAADAFLSETAAADLLPLLARGRQNRQLRLALFEIGGFVARGYTPANAFAMYGHVFGTLFAQLAATADDNAAFCGALDDLAQYYAREAYFTQKIRRGIFYPAGGGLLLCCALAAAAGYAGAAVWVMLSCAGLVALYAHGRGFRSWADMRLATLPLAGRVTMTLCTLRLTRGLSLLIQHDVPLSALPDGMRPLTRNRAAADKVTKAVARMQAGKELPAVLEAFQFFAPSFPPAFYNALLQGYQCGDLAERLAQLCPIFEQRAEEALGQAAKWLMVLWTLAAVCLIGMITLH